jgi:hypothetical protein
MGGRFLFDEKQSQGKVSLKEKQYNVRKITLLSNFRQVYTSQRKLA